MRFPPPSRRYSPISVVTSTLETASRSNSRSMATRSSRRRSKTSLAAALAEEVMLVGPVIGELHIDAKVPVLEHPDDLLQGIAILAADPDRVALNRGLHLQLGVLDHLDDVAGLLHRYPLLQLHLLPHGRARRRFHHP